MTDSDDFKTTGIAIAVLAEKNFSFFNGVPFSEAIASSWTTLLVAARWHAEATQKLRGSSTFNFQINLPAGMTPQEGAKFAQEVALAASVGEVSMPPFSDDHLNQVLIIVIEITTRYLEDFAEMTGDTYEDVIVKLRQSYLTMLAQGSGDSE